MSLSNPNGSASPPWMPCAVNSRTPKVIQSISNCYHFTPHGNLPPLSLVG
jgi:hypothetical protein